MKQVFAALNEATRSSMREKDHCMIPIEPDKTTFLSNPSDQET